MVKNSKSRTQHERALEDPKTRALLDKLVAEWGDLDLVERGVRLEPLKKAGCSDHGLGKALNADPKTISRCRHIAELPAEQRAQIARGTSAVSFLRAQQNLQKCAEATRSDPREAKNSHAPNAGKLTVESRPDPAVDAKLQALQRQIEPLTNSVQQLEKRIHKLETYQEIILSSLKEDADAAAADEEGPFDSRWSSETKKSTGRGRRRRSVSQSVGRGEEQQGSPQAHLSELPLNSRIRHERRLNPSRILSVSTELAGNLARCSKFLIYSFWR